MTRTLLAIGLCGMAMGATCSVDLALECSNDLDGSGFGFALAVPSEFECAGALPSPFALTQTRYLQPATDITVSVQVTRSPGIQEEDGECITIEDLGETTNPQGVTFDRFKVTIDCPGAFSYMASTRLPGEHFLVITVTGPSETASMADAFARILASVQRAESTE